TKVGDVNRVRGFVDKCFAQMGFVTVTDGGDHLAAGGVDDDDLAGTGGRAIQRLRFLVHGQAEHGVVGNVDAAFACQCLAVEDDDLRIVLAPLADGRNIDIAGFRADDDL